MPRIPAATQAWLLGEPEPSLSQPELRRYRRWLRLVLAALLGLVVVLGAGWFASSRVRQQLDARLIAAGAGANAGLIAVQSEQLALLRELTFTQGLGQALETENASQLNTLVTPLQANSGVPMVDVVLPSGKVIFAVRSTGAPRPVRSRAGLPAINTALATAHGSFGGRFSEIAVLRDGPLLLTIGPALVGSQPVGVFMVMTPLADVLARLAAQSGAVFTAYNTLGQPIATTSPGTPPLIPRDQARQLMRNVSLIDFRQTSGQTREALGRLIVLHRPEAILGASLHDNSWVTQFWVDLIGWLGLAAVLIAMDVHVPSRRTRPASPEMS